MTWCRPPGAWQAYQFGARGAPLAQATGLAASASARSFGGFLGVCAGASCMLAAARGKADIWNVIASGAAAGTFGTLKTRNPAFIAGSAAVGAAHYATNEFDSPPFFLSSLHAHAIQRPALAIELVWPGFASSRIRALQHTTSHPL